MREAAALRELWFVAKPDVFLRFQLRHPQEMAKHIEPMTLCQPGEVGNYFPDKHRSVIWPAVAMRLIG
jgi:hypothetical protein